MAEIYVSQNNINKPQSQQSQDPALEGVDLSKPLTGEEISELIKLRTVGQIDYNPTHEDFLAYNEWNKNRHINVMDGLMEGGMAVLGDLGNAVGAVFDHPLEATAKFAPSVVEAFMQGSRNLYGMVAQSQDPNSTLFKWKNALSHDGSVDGYNQFLEALDFNKRSAELASGKDTILINKDYIDQDITLAASYIADPTLFIPFGTVASAGLKAAGLGSRVARIGARVEGFKGALIGGSLKMAGGAIEAVGGATRATMDGALSVGGNVLETATGMSAKEWQATARMSGMTGSVANMMGADIAGVSGLSGAYIASGAARGAGEALGAVGEQILKQGGKRGFNSFAVDALKQTPNLSPHAQKLLKVLDSVDPMLSYAGSIGEGMAQGAVIGGGLGYLSAGKEGMAQGIGAGVALGGVGAGLGRMYADYTGGTMYQRAEIQGTFVMENWKKTSPEKHAFGEKLLADATATGDRAGALQILAGLDKIAPDARFFAGSTTELTAFLKSKGYDLQGFKIDPQTGARVKDANGKEIQVNKDATELKYTEGGVFTMHIDKVNGKKQTTMFINTDHSANTTYHHELFHTVFRETVMKDFFKDKLASKLLGEYENGVKIKNGEVHPKEFRAFAKRYNEALHKNNPKAFNDAMKQFDASISEWNRAKKLGKDSMMGADGNTQAGKAAQQLEYFVEEFGAYYFTQMMKGKPLDYLFKGADLGGIRGAFESIHNSFLDFFEGRARKTNPQGAGRFDFSKGLDKGFGEATGTTGFRVNPLTGETIAKAGDRTGVTGQGVGITGTSTKRVRVGGIDYLMRDLIRATASQSKGSVGGVDVRTWTPEARTAFFEGRGADGLKFQFDKNGNRLTDNEEKQLRKEHGKLIFDALATLDPTIVKDGVIAGTLSDAHIKHLVDKGLISVELGNRIKNIQRMVNDPTVPNVVSHDYSGNTKELEGDVNNPARLRKDKGDYVPLTNRESIIFDYRFSVDKEGNTVMIAESLDKQVLDFRGNKQWANPEVRQLFGDNRDAFDKAFIEYIRNANKDANDRTRVESAKLPLLEVGDGLGEKRRDIMHQVAGFAKAKGSDYINPPLAEIKRNTRSTRQSLRVDLMSDVKAQSTTRFEFNDKNAFKDISGNFKPSEMDSETTPNGTVYKHPNNSSILKATDGAYSVYDSRNKLVGKYKTEAEASRSLEYNFNKEEQRTQRNIETGIRTQQKVQGSFKVIDVATRKEAERTGNIFTTQWGKEFTAGTKVVPQTREEFMASQMIKFRQAKPEVIRQVVEAKVAEVQGMRQRLEQIKLEYKAEFWRNGMESTKTKALQKEANFLQSRVNKYDLLEHAVQADKAKGGEGTFILEVINNLRENGGTYNDISKMLFSDAYDKQFKTGEPVTTVATHGTTSEGLLKAMDFDINRLGETHGSEADKVGAFLSGSTSTSQNYSYGKENIGLKSQPMRQVRALVKMENPYVVDLNYKAFDQRLYDGHFKLAKEGGHDGVIFQNVYDGGGGADSVFVPFAEKLAQNTAILDTVKTDVRTFDDKGYSPAERPSVGRGTETLSDIREGSFKPSEDYSSDDSYYKGKSNPFESKDEQGFKVRKFSARDENNGLIFNRDVVNYLQIGHDNKKGDKLWVWDSQKNVLKTSNAKEGYTHSDWLGEGNRRFDVQGRIELPTYDKSGKLIKKGKISITSPRETSGLQTISDLNFYKEALSNSIKQPIDDFDAYYFGNNQRIKNSMGYGLRDEAGIRFKPSEQQMKSEFIGKQAENNPSKISGLNLKFWEDKKLTYGENNITLVINKPESKGQSGQQVGIIMAKIYDDNTAKILDVRVNNPHENKGYGKILYSELAERLRHLGAKEIIGDVTNKEGIPQKIREKVIGNSRTDYDSPSNISESGYKTVSTLDANTRYKPVEQLVQHGFEKSELNKELLASGHIVLNYNQSELAGKHIVINNPDTMMTGELKAGEKVIAKGNGGVNFISESGDVWANSVKWKAEQTAKLLRRSQQQNGGKAYFALTRGALEKVLNSHSGAKGGMAVLEHLVEQKLININEFKSALKDISVKYNLDINTSGDYKSLHKEIAEKFYGVSDSTFKARGTFVTDIINHLALKGKSGQKNIKQIREVLQSNKLGKNIDFAATGIKEAIGLLMSDKRANVEKSNVYVYIEIEGNISVENMADKGGHPSYPFHIVARDPKTGEKIRPRMFFPEKTNYITDLVNNEKGEPVPRIVTVKDKNNKDKNISGASYLGSSTVSEAYGIMKNKEHISNLTGNTRLNWKVSEGVKKGVSSIDSTIADINKRSVVPSAIQNALDNFKEALRKQDATDEIVVKEVEETHTELLNAINNEMSSSSEATLPDLRIIKKKVEAVDRGLKKNQGRIGDKVKKNYQSEMDEGADIESQQAIRRKNEVEQDMSEGADIESEQSIRASNEVQSDMETGASIEGEQAFDRTQERVAQEEANMAEGADIEGEQAFDAREQASAEAERQSNAQAQAQTQAGNAQAQSQPQPTPQPRVTNERDAWRLYATERTPNGSITKNSRGYSIILNGTKLRVYNPQNVLLGIYTDLEQAKRRVQREEPKPR